MKNISFSPSPRLLQVWRTPNHNHIVKGPSGVEKLVRLEDAEYQLFNSLCVSEQS